MASKSERAASRFRKLPIEADGHIEGLSVVGFAGYIGPNNTPARRGLVLADEDGEIVHIRRMDLSKREVVCSAWSGVRVHDIREQVMALHPPCRFYANQVALVVGPREYGRARQLGVVTSTDSDRLRAFVRAISSGEPPFVEPVIQCQDNEKIAVWLCSPEEASEIMRRAHVMVREIVVNAWKGPSSVVYDAAWWLSRTCESWEEIAEAAFALLYAGNVGASRALLGAHGIDWVRSEKTLASAGEKLVHDAAKL